MRKCIYCGDALEFPYRDDKNYCDKSTCRSLAHQNSARDYRQSDDTSILIHEHKPRINQCFCVVCGTEFDVNDYALRGGKREPLYCSRKCKQKAYRERKKAGKG